jgi:hypothetical protein
MKILTLSKKIEALKAETDILKDTLASELNLYIRPLYKKTISPWYTISVTRRTLDKGTYHFLAGHDILEVWESSHDDSEHAACYSIPVSFLTDKQFLKTWKKMQEDYKKALVQGRKEQAAIKKAQKEEYDRKEFARLKKKFA